MMMKLSYLLYLVAVVCAAPQQLDFSAPDTTGVHDLMGHDLMSPDDFNENDFDGNIILDQPDELNEISRSQNQNLNSISSSKKKDEDTKKSSEVSEKEELNANETAAVLNDPCYAVDCERGAMCVVTNKQTNKTSCICPTVCQNEDNPVCSVYGKEYKSKCELHKETCTLGKTIKIAYNGKCIAKQGPCLNTELIQFPIRFLEWMMHLRQHEKAGETDANAKIVDLTPNEKLTVAEWMFNRLDLENDLKLQQLDLHDILLYLLPVEHCVDEFLKSCDSDGNGDISLTEWKVCLLPGSNTVEDSFFDLVKK